MTRRTPVIGLRGQLGIGVRLFSRYRRRFGAAVTIEN
jgi:hypothetical protein